jgi:hypothetical protein
VYTCMHELDSSSLTHTGHSRSFSIRRRVRPCPHDYSGTDQYMAHCILLGSGEHRPACHKHGSTALSLGPFSFYTSCHINQPTIVGINQVTTAADSSLLSAVYLWSPSETLRRQTAFGPASHATAMYGASTHAPTHAPPLFDRTHFSFSQRVLEICLNPTEPVVTHENTVAIIKKN